MNTESFCNIELIWDECFWVGQSTKPSKIELVVHSEEETPHAPHELQIHTWTEFLDNYDLISDLIVKEVLAYYVEARPRYLKMGTEWVEDMPIVNSPKEIESMIRLKYVYIDWPYSDDVCKIGLSYSCDWEAEHGLGVVLEKNIVKKVGLSDCALL